MRINHKEVQQEQHLCSAKPERSGNLMLLLRLHVGKFSAGLRFLYENKQ